MGGEFEAFETELDAYRDRVENTSNPVALDSVDGHDVRDMALSDLRESIGYVSQDTFLFDGTVAENICYGRFDARMADVKEAAKAAEAHEFIEGLSERYETRVGEHGVTLSGGSASGSRWRGSSVEAGEIDDLPEEFVERASRGHASAQWILGGG